MALFFVLGHCPGPSSMLSSIPPIHPLDGDSTSLPVVTRPGTVVHLTRKGYIFQVTWRYIWHSSSARTGSKNKERGNEKWVNFNDTTFLCLKFSLLLAPQPEYPQKLEWLDPFVNVVMALLEILKGGSCELISKECWYRVREATTVGLQCVQAVSHTRLLLELTCI